MPPHRVLLVDKSTFPSDQVLSTHLVWPPGIACLQRWGLLPEVLASGCPALSRARFDVGPVVLQGGFWPTDGGIADAYAPRRTVLDEVLVRGAIAAGAELREACVMSRLISDEHGAVRGVALRSRAGTHAEHAALVIGADGMRSSVAAEVRPPAIGEHEPMQGTYFTYWDGVALDRIEVYVRPDRAVYGWMTNDELALVGVNWSARDYQAVRGTVERSYLDVLEGVAPALAGRMRGARRAGRWIGGSVPGFLRRPYGPGWALVGDAGYHKDPVTAQGISDAFRDAERLADAVDAGLSGRRPLAPALADYEMRRNQAVMAMFEFTTQMARLEPPPADMVQLFTALQGNHEQISRFLGVLAATVPVEQFFSPDNLAQVFAASTRG